MKKKTIFFLGLIALAYNSFSQDATGDALKALHVKRIIFVKKTKDNDGKLSLGFSADHRGLDYDNATGQISVAVSENKTSLLIKCEYQNPLQYQIDKNITSVSDPSYEAIVKFADQISQFTSLLNSGNVVQNTVQQNPNVAAAVAMIPGQPGFTTLENNINAPSLSAYKYIVFNGKDGGCITQFDDLINNYVLKVDTAFYNSDPNYKDKDFNNIFSKYFSQLNNASNSKDYIAALANFDGMVADLVSRAKKTRKDMDNLRDFLSSMTVVASLPAGKSVTGCTAFLNYTKTAMQEFITTAYALQDNRDKLLTAAASLSKQLNIFKESIDNYDSPSPKNTFLLTRAKIDPKVISTIKISYKKINVTISDNKDITITSDVANSFDGSINLRAFRSFVLELSSGLFYTNLSYPKYGVSQDSSGKFSVASAGQDKYNLVAATHLNIIPNIFEGEFHPMFQLGVGTAKDLPSLLAGFGCRIVGAAKISISIGGIWTWRKELDKLHIGDQVGGTTELNNDLKYTFQNKPSFYAGIMYNF